MLDALVQPLPATWLYQSTRTLVVAATDMHKQDEYGVHPRVAVKLMLYGSDYQREVLARKRFQLSSDFVVPIISCHEPSIAQVTSARAPQGAIIEVPSTLSGFEAFYIIVMPLGGTCLILFYTIHISLSFRDLFNF